MESDYALRTMCRDEIRVLDDGPLLLSFERFRKDDESDEPETLDEYLR